MLEKREFEKNDFMWRMSTTVTVVAGLFVAIVFMLLIINYLQVRSADPINDLLLTELRQQYAAAEQRDEAMAQRIQELDLLTRKAFFASQNHLRIGGFLLLVGVSVFLVAFKSMARWKPDVPELSETPAAEREWIDFARSRQAIVWTGVVILASGLLAALLTESLLEPSMADGGEGGEDGAGTEPPVVVAKEYPTWDVVELNWPTFRGPGAYGVAHFTNAPTQWDVESGEGVRWKIKLPREGTNSPVVWGKRLFLSGATETEREIYCFDTETGDLLWTQVLPTFDGTPAEPPGVTEDTGFAAPTLAVHGDQVFAIFANGDVASYDFDGKLVWGRSLGIPDNHYGHSSSLLAYENLLYVQFDQFENARLLALSAETGKDVWVAQREKISWASPILAHTPVGPQVIVNNEENVDAYDPLTGSLIWAQTCLGGEVAPSPAYSNGYVFVANEYAMASAIHITGAKDAVATEIAWEYDELLPDCSSPVGDGERFYISTSIGDLVSLDAKTGETVWEEERDDGFYCSPVLVGDRIYIFDLEGNLCIFRAGAAFEVIASLSMGEPVFATPAYMDGRIYIKTTEHLFCIE